jgi:WD40 repeat protein
MNITNNKEFDLKVHDSEIQIIEVNKKGTLFATASKKGTTIKVFDTNNGKQLKELRRGLSNSTIYSISFDENDNYLVCSSSSGNF